MTDVLTAALGYIERGSAPLPVPFRTKRTRHDAWQNLRISAESAANFFNGGPQNIGIILGSASGGLCDLDFGLLRGNRRGAVFLAPDGCLRAREQARLALDLSDKPLRHTGSRGAKIHGLGQARTPRGPHGRPRFSGADDLSAIGACERRAHRMGGRRSRQRNQHRRRRTASARASTGSRCGNCAQLSESRRAGTTPPSCSEAFWRAVGSHRPGRRCSPKRSPLRPCSRETSAAI